MRTAHCRVRKKSFPYSGTIEIDAIIDIDLFQIRQQDRVK
jgi:hypothetical protein